jgi:hypothetical protein
VDTPGTKGPGIKPSDALGTLRARSRMSQTVMVLVAVAGLIVGAMLLGLIWRGVTGGIKNAPSIPAIKV